MTGAEAAELATGELTASEGWPWTGARLELLREGGTEVVEEWVAFEAVESAAFGRCDSGKAEDR